MSTTPQTRTLQTEDLTSGSTANPWFNVVKQQVEALKFGSVTVTVHEGRVVQVETSLKVRFDRKP